MQMSAFFHMFLTSIDRIDKIHKLIVLSFCLVFLSIEMLLRCATDFMRYVKDQQTDWLIVPSETNAKPGRRHYRFYGNQFATFSKVGVVWSGNIVQYRKCVYFKHTCKRFYANGLCEILLLATIFFYLHHTEIISSVISISVLKCQTKSRHQKV